MFQTRGIIYCSLVALTYHHTLYNTLFSKNSAVFHAVHSECMSPFLKNVSPCLSNDPLDKVALHQVFLRHVAVHSPTENAPYAAG